MQTSQQQHAKKNIISNEEEEKGEKKNMTPLEYLFIGNASAKLLAFLMQNKDFDFSLSDMKRGADVSMKTINRDVPKLEELGMIYHTKVIGPSKMYEVNKESPIIKNFFKFVFEVATVLNYHELIKQGYEKEANQLIAGKKYFSSNK